MNFQGADQRLVPGMDEAAKTPGWRLVFAGQRMQLFGIYRQQPDCEPARWERHATQFTASARRNKDGRLSCRCRWCPSLVGVMAECNTAHRLKYRPGRPGTIRPDCWASGSDMAFAVHRGNYSSLCSLNLTFAIFMLARNGTNFD